MQNGIFLPIQTACIPQTDMLLYINENPLFVYWGNMITIRKEALIMKKNQNDPFPIILFAIIIFVFFLHVMTYLSLSVNTTQYTKVTGVVVEKYIRRYETNGRVRTYRFLKVKYTFNGEEQIAEHIPSNIWEGEGSTVHLFLTSDDKIARSLCVEDFEIIMLICCIVYFAYVWIKNKNELSLSQSAIVGTVINDYEIPLNEPTDLESSSYFAEPPNPEASSSAEFPEKEVPKQPVFELYTEEEYNQLQSKPSERKPLL